MIFLYNTDRLDMLSGITEGLFFKTQTRHAPVEVPPVNQLTQYLTLPTPLIVATKFCLQCSMAANPLRLNQKISSVWYIPPHHSPYLNQIIQIGFAWHTPGCPTMDILIFFKPFWTLDTACKHIVLGLLRMI